MRWFQDAVFSKGFVDMVSRQLFFWTKLADREFLARVSGQSSPE